MTPPRVAEIFVRHHIALKIGSPVYPLTRSNHRTYSSLAVEIPFRQRLGFDPNQIDEWGNAILP